MDEKLLSALADLSARKFGSEEGNELLAPFMKQTMKIQAAFVSNQRTFTSRYEKSYVDGQTVLALIGETKHEVAILIHPDSNWKEDHKPILPLSQGDVFEIEVEVLGYNSLHQRVTFGESMPQEMKFSQNEGAYGAKPDITVKIPSKLPTVQRARRRRKSSDEDELEERERRKFVFDASDSENQGCGSLPLNLEQGCQKWLFILLLFCVIAFLIGVLSGLLSNL